MQKGFAVLTMALLVVLAQVGMRMLFDGWTLGTLERFWTDPEISDQPVGYEPPDLLALQRRLLDGRYGELDAHLAGLQGEYLAGARPELEYTLTYIAFQTTNPDIGAALDRWVAARPDSAAALTARANYLMHRAWWTGKFAQPRPEPSENAGWEPATRIYAQARRDLEKAVSLDPRNIVAYAKLIAAERRIGDGGLAPGIRARGLAVDPLSFVIHQSWVAQLLDGPDGLQAARNYVDSIRPDFARKPLLKRLDVQILVHRAWMLAKEDETDKAIDLLFETGAIAESAYVLSYRARLLRKTDQHDWAEADLDRAYEYLPHLVRTLAERAELYAETDRAELARQDFALALELDPLNPRTLWKRYKTSYREGRYREAEADLTTTMRLRPDDPLLKFHRGGLRLKKLDDAAGAAEDLAIATGGYPDSPNVWQSYVRALTEIDDCRAVAALAEYRRACEVTESDECGGSTIKAETRRVDKMSARMACAPSG